MTFRGNTTLLISSLALGGLIAAAGAFGLAQLKTVGGGYHTANFAQRGDDHVYASPRGDEVVKETAETQAAAENI